MYAATDVANDPVYWGPAQCIAKYSMAPDFGLTAPDSASSPASSSSAPSSAGPGPAVAEHIWLPGPSKFVGEPCFVARPNPRSEDDGWLLVVVNDSDTNKAQFCILDAQDVEAGPVCTINLPHHLPAGLHGSFTPEYLGPQEAAAPQWKDPNRIRSLG